MFLYKDMLDIVRTNFRFREEIQTHVDLWLWDIKTQFGVGKELVYVGVHCRRTDYGEYMKRKYGGNANEVDHHFFEKGFDMYRYKLGQVWTVI